MKKILLLLIVLLAASNAWSQIGPIKKGDWSTGLILQTGSRRAFSIGVGVQYTPIEKIRADLNVNYYFSLNYDLNLNMHYLIDIHKGRLYVYPLLGFTAANMDAADGDVVNYPRESHVGANFGAGVEWLLDYDLSLMAELRHAAMKRIGHTAVAAGMRLKF